MALLGALIVPFGCLLAVQPIHALPPGDVLPIPEPLERGGVMGSETGKREGTQDHSRTSEGSGRVTSYSAARRSRNRVRWA